MSKLKLRPTPLINGLPIKIGKLILSDAQPEAITAIMLHKGSEAALKKSLGAWVKPGESKDTKHGRLIWSGMDQAFLFAQAQVKSAACVDVSDGWVFMALNGKGADNVLARLAPLDLRRDKVTAGQVFRSQLGHLMALIIVTDKGFEIGVMSSFAETAKNEIAEAMESVTALGVS